MDARVAVLVSGSGTNLQALLDDPVVGSRIALVVSDRKGARALQRAQERGVRTAVVVPAEHVDRAAYDIAMRDLLVEEAIDYVVNAGFMRVLGRAFGEEFGGRWMNVHPALLPSFPGAHAVRDALTWGVKVSGVTIHLVEDEQVDAGPVVFQEPVPVLPGDDESSLHARIQEVEHRLYPRAVRALIEGRLKVEGRKVRILGEGA